MVVAGCALPRKLGRLAWVGLLLVFFHASHHLYASTPETTVDPPLALTRSAVPYPHPGEQRVRRAQWSVDPTLAPLQILTALILGAEQTLPTLHWLGQEDVRRQDLHFTPQRWSYPGPRLDQPFGATPALTPTVGLIDQWVLRLHENFAQPAANCVTFDAQRKRNHAGWQALTTGAGQPYALQPLVEPGRNSWLVCGPVASAGAGHLLARFTYRLRIAEGSDAEFFFGVSTNGRDFRGTTITGFTSDWLTQQIYLDGLVGEHIWLAWAFTGANAVAHNPALALADLQVWHYRPPNQVCGGQTQGNKGVVLPAYDPTAHPPAPMLRAGDGVAAVNLQAAGIRWVRLGFQIQAGALDLLAYDRLVDTLCAHGIGVLGLLNQEMLPRTDYSSPDPAQFDRYRQEFVALTRFLARYFARRVNTWEIWNEPNLSEGAYLSPPRYADLLQQSYGAIKRANPHAQVVFGGLASAWPDSHAYLAGVYAEWEANYGGAHPFDHLGLHPYPRKGEGPNPANFLVAEPEYRTILDKFLQLMAEQGDGDKRIWITELGFNSAKLSRNHPLCLSGVLVDEAEQAAFASAAMDLLFNQVTLWGKPDQPAVAKLFWYQYMDVGAVDPCWPATSRSGRVPKDWWFGLYRGDKVTPKPVWCAFAAYPLPCGAKQPAVLYLPVVARESAR